MSEDENDPDFRDLMVETLNQNGVLAKIRAELRAQIYLTLDEDLEERRNQTKSLFERTEETEALFLIYDFLNFYNLDFTLSVFEAETDYNEVTSNRNQNMFFQNINLNSQLKTTPLLVHILKKFKKLSSTKTCLSDSEQLYNLNSTYDLKPNHNTTYNNSVTNKSNFENSLYLHYGSSSVDDRSNFEINNAHDHSNKTSPWSESSGQFQDSLNVSEDKILKPKQNGAYSEEVDRADINSIISDTYTSNDNSKRSVTEDKVTKKNNENNVETSPKKPNFNVPNVNNSSSSDISEDFQIDSDELSNSGEQSSRCKEQVIGNGDNYRMIYKDTEMSTKFGENFSDSIDTVIVKPSENGHFSKKDSPYLLEESKNLLIDLNKTCSPIGFVTPSAADSKTKVAQCILDETIVESTCSGSISEQKCDAPETIENGYKSDNSTSSESRTESSDLKQHKVTSKISTGAVTNGQPNDYPLNLDTELQMLAKKINIDNFDSENSDFDLSPSINNSLKEIESNIDTLKLKCDITKNDIEKKNISNEKSNIENKPDSTRSNLSKLDAGKTSSRSMGEIGSLDLLQNRDYNKSSSKKSDKAYKSIPLEQMSEEKSPKSDSSLKLSKLNAVNEKISKLSSLSDLPPILTKPKTSTTLPSFYLDKNSPDCFDLDLDSLDNYKEDDIFSTSGSEIQEISMLSTNNDISPKPGDAEDVCNEKSFPYFNKDRVNVQSDYVTSRGLFTMTSRNQGEDIYYGMGDGIEQMNTTIDNENK